MIQVNGEFLDGFSPRSHPCEVEIHSSELVLKFPDGTITRWRPILLLSTTVSSDKIRLSLQGAETRVNDPVLTIPDRPEIQHALGVFRGEPNISVPIPFKILLLLGGITAMAVLVMLLLSNIWRLIPEKVDVALGDSLHDMILNQYGLEVSDMPDMQVFLEKCAKRLSEPDSPFESSITIIDNSETNAFALPGGRIYFFTGLIKESNSPEELAGIMAHEMAHVERRHTMKNLSKAVGTVFLISTMVGIVGGLEELETAELLLEGTSLIAILHYSRKMESDADEWALRKMQREGISAFGMRDFFKRLKEDNEGLESIIPDWASTHPGTEERLRNMETHLASEPNLLPLLDATSWAQIRGGE